MDFITNRCLLEIEIASFSLFCILPFSQGNLSSIIKSPLKGTLS